MLPSRWDPLRELNTLHKEMDDLFRRTFGQAREPGEESRQMMAPLVDTFVKGDTFHVRAELPGVDKDDIDVSVEGNILTLKAERKEDTETEEGDYHMRESRSGFFMRRLTLPEGARTEDIHASYEKGILEVTVPVEKEAVGGRKVMVEGPESSKEEKKKIH